MKVKYLQKGDSTIHKSLVLWNLRAIQYIDLDARVGKNILCYTRKPNEAVNNKSQKEGTVQLSPFKSNISEVCVLSHKVQYAHLSPYYHHSINLHSICITQSHVYHMHFSFCKIRLEVLLFAGHASKPHTWRQAIGSNINPSVISTSSAWPFSAAQYRIVLSALSVVWSLEPTPTSPPLAMYRIPC